MIFSLIDYFNYKRKRKQYSVDLIRKQGGTELNDENYENIFPLKPSIILVHPTNSFISWLVMYTQGGPWSHTLFPVDFLNVLDTTLAGTVIHPFKDYFNQEIYAIIFNFRLPNDIIDFQPAIEIAKESVGSKYGYHKAIIIFLKTIIGLNHGYRLKLSFDFLFILLLVYGTLSMLGFTTIVVIYISIFYIAFTIIGNILRYLEIGKYGSTVQEYKKFRKEVINGYKDRSK